MYLISACMKRIPSHPLFTCNSKIFLGLQKKPNKQQQQKNVLTNLRLICELTFCDAATNILGCSADFSSSKHNNICSFQSINWWEDILVHGNLQCGGICLSLSLSLALSDIFNSPYSQFTFTLLSLLFLQKKCFLCKDCADMPFSWCCFYGFRTNSWGQMAKDTSGR